MWDPHSKLTSGQLNGGEFFPIGFIQSAIGTFFTPARSALVPNVVPEADLLATSSITQTSQLIFGLLGMAAAGVLVGVIDTYWPIFSVDALTFFIPLILIAQIRYQSQPASHANQY